MAAKRVIRFRGPLGWQDHVSHVDKSDLDVLL